MKSARKSDDVIRFVGHLTLSGDYSGKPFVLREWQKDIIRSIYDRVDGNGLRTITDVGIWLPRKNAKTELAAALAAYHLLCDPVEGEIYSAAGEREQAGIIFRKLAGMIRRNSQMSANCKIVDSQKRIVNTKTGTFFWSLSAEEGSKHGFNPSVVIGDEIHVWKRRELWTALTTGSDTRAEKLFITITTAGVWDDASLETELYEYACKVRDGVIEDSTYLPVIYEAGQDADPWDEDVWRRCNPALGDFRSLDAMRKLADRAQKNPRLENDFRRLYLNQHTQQTTRWLNLVEWDACRDEPVSGPCYGGLDLSSTTDLTSFCIATKGAKAWALEWLYFIPEARAREIEHNDRVPYHQWTRDGWIVQTPGEVIDYEFVWQHIVELCEQRKVKLVGYDPWNAETTRQALEREGFECIQVRQGAATLSSPCKELERSVIDGSFGHGCNPVTRWCASNAEVNTDPNGNIRPMKPKHGAHRKRIDGIAAVLNAMAVAMQDQDVANVYQSRGILGI